MSKLEVNTTEDEMPTPQLVQSDDQLSVSNGNEKIIGEPKACKPLEEEKLYAGKSLNLTKFYFEDSNGMKRAQEGIQRARKSSPRSLGQRNLCTIGILKRQIMCDALILVKQYRAPLKAYTLEFPARVLEGPALRQSSVDFEDIINREIEDDTGYTSTDIKYISPPTALDPDVSDCKVRLVSLLVDGDDPLQHPSPKSVASSTDDDSNEHGHVVEVLQVPVNGLLDRLKEYSKQGFVVDSRVYAFAIGLKKGEKLALAHALPPDAESMY